MNLSCLRWDGSVIWSIWERFVEARSIIRVDSGNRLNIISVLSQNTGSVGVYVS